MSMQSAVVFRAVDKSFGSGYVLQNFDLDIPAGKIVTLIGPSGSGKTTILKMINRLVEPNAGTIVVNGSDVSKIDPVLLRRSIGYVIQQIGLFPHMTIEDNLTVVPRLKGQRKKSMAALTAQLLELIGLDYGEFRHRYPHELSGGQQQRIGVARALAADPSIVLMDEPFSALDPISRVQLQNELMKLNQTVKKTIVFVTHDIEEALKIADQIVLLKNGKLVRSCTPDQLVTEPADAFVREFVGEERFRAADLKNVSRTAGDLMLAEQEDHAVRMEQALAAGAPSIEMSMPGTAVFRLLMEHPVLLVLGPDRSFVGLITRDDVYPLLADRLLQGSVLG
ncbi:ABC transporter ATP-binding protein [Paenibacillus sp. R14(2021)]|uniref:ABC transporter ATP-binding protein n=1 Tax=Paenibacillus sp. R14(2021) TaxID=2859228 RepID=UPI0021578FB8|nr:ABC transporter ATP-binding protein [Paenibacillus sp. R14(2021)]